MSTPKKPDLPAGWKRRIRANRVEGMVNRGGHLRFFEMFLEYKPNLLERIIGTAEGQFRYTDILHVSVIGTDLSSESVFAGGVRRRLFIELRNGDSETFVVGNVDRVAAQIQEAASLEHDSEADPAPGEED